MNNMNCPKCNSGKVKIVVFGLLADNTPSKFFDEHYCKGCVVDCDCRWHCEACHWEWGGSDDYPANKQGHYDLPSSNSEEEEK